MRYLILFMLIAGVCMAEELQIKQESYYMKVPVYAASGNDYTIKLSEAPDCKVWFDRKSNKWKYEGDIEKIGDAILNLANQPYCPELVPSMIEIYRELRDGS